MEPCSFSSRDERSALRDCLTILRRLTTNGLSGTLGPRGDRTHRQVALTDDACLPLNGKHENQAPTSVPSPRPQTPHERVYCQRPGIRIGIGRSSQFQAIGTCLLQSHGCPMTMPFIILRQYSTSRVVSYLMFSHLCCSLPSHILCFLCVTS